MRQSVTKLREATRHIDVLSSGLNATYGEPLSHPETLDHLDQIYRHASQLTQLLSRAQKLDYGVLTLFSAEELVDLQPEEQETEDGKPWRHLGALDHDTWVAIRRAPWMPRYSDALTRLARAAAKHKAAIASSAVVGPSKRSEGTAREIQRAFIRAIRYTHLKLLDRDPSNPWVATSANLLAFSDEELDAEIVRAIVKSSGAKGRKKSS